MFVLFFVKVTVSEQDRSQVYPRPLSGERVSQPENGSPKMRVVVIHGMMYNTDDQKRQDG